MHSSFHTELKINANIVTMALNDRNTGRSQLVNVKGKQAFVMYIGAHDHVSKSEKHYTVYQSSNFQ